MLYQMLVMMFIVRRQ